MKLAYCNNIWTHHQSPICEEFARILGEDEFRLCLFEPVYEERRGMGWSDDVPDHRWIAGPPSSPNELRQLTELVCDADVAVVGHCPIEVREARVRTGKLTFLMSERVMRNGFFRLRMINPRFARGIRRLRSVANHTHVHYLAIGEYAPYDAHLIGLFGNRIWKWAYFMSGPEIPYQDRSGTNIQILGVGRFLKLKQMDVILHAAAMLGAELGDCRIELIGTGPKKEACIRLSKRLRLADRVRFTDCLPHAVVRRRMAESDILIFPSNHLEGWGAVVGEAMSEGCVVLSNASAGVSKVLIEDGVNGFIFQNRDIVGLAGMLKLLLSNAEVRNRIGESAAETMQRLWHPRVGAERLIALWNGLLGDAPMPNYSEGPCSRCFVGL